MGQYRNDVYCTARLLSFCSESLFFTGAARRGEARPEARNSRWTCNSHIGTHVILVKTVISAS